MSDKIQQLEALLSDYRTAFYDAGKDDGISGTQKTRVCGDAHDKILALFEQQFQAGAERVLDCLAENPHEFRFEYENSKLRWGHDGCWRGSRKDLFLKYIGFTKDRA